VKASALAVVLVHPEHDGNVGAAARALGNLGLSDLRLVGGVKPGAEARAFACRSNDVLASARRHDDLAAALADCTFAVALVSPMRARAQEAVALRTLRGRIARLTECGTVALVFGGEQSGLPRDAVARCNVAATIPLPSARPTLNLAQAVLLAGYELLCVSEGDMPPASAEAAAPAGDAPATHGEVDEVLRALAAALDRLGYDPQEELHHRILARCRALALRATVTRADVRMLHGLLARLDPRRC